MFEALFLNPLTPAQMKGRKTNKSKAKNTVKSKRLKGWQAVVKKHGGDMTAASKEWKSRSRAGGTSRRGAGSAAKGNGRGRLSGLAARRAASYSKGVKGGVPMAARKKAKRRRNQLPPTKAWVAKWRAGMTRAGRKVKASAPKFRKISSDVNEGKAQWKRRYKTKLGTAMLKHRRGKSKRSGAPAFSRAVLKGLASFNPVTAEQWASRFTRSTGYGAYKRKWTKKGKVSRRRRGARPMTPTWRRAVARGVKSKGRRRYASAVSKPGLPLKYQEKLIDAMTSTLRKKNPVRRRKSAKRRRRTMKRYPIMRASQARALMKNMRPRKRRKKAKRRRYSRRSNPVAASLAAMYTRSALENAAFITGGVAVGAVIPNLVTRYVWKGEKSPFMDMGIGILGSIVAGLGVAMGTKDDTKGALVAAGGIAGALGAMIASQLNKALGFSGFGQAAEDALQAAVETEMERAGLTGMGQFLLPSEAEELPSGGAAGMGQFLTEPELETDVATTEGLGYGTATADMMDDGTAAFAGIDGSVF